MNSFGLLASSLSDGTIAAIVSGIVTVLGAITAFLQKNKILEYREKRRAAKEARRRTKQAYKLAKEAIEEKVLDSPSTKEVIEDFIEGGTKKKCKEHHKEKNKKDDKIN